MAPRSREPPRRYACRTGCRLRHRLDRLSWSIGSRSRSGKSCTVIRSNTSFCSSSAASSGGQSKCRQAGASHRRKIRGRQCQAVAAASSRFSAIVCINDCAGALCGPKSTQPGEQHAGIEEHAHGQRFRSSSMSAVMSTEGRSAAATVGLAMRRRPIFTRRGPAAVRVRRIPSSSSVISSSRTRSQGPRARGQPPG